MRTHIFLAALVCGIVACASVRAQMTPEEAMKRLAAKEAARQADRTRPVTITAGELDDLRAEVALLKAEVARLKAGGAGGGGTPVAARVQRVRSLAIGETRDQVFDFLRRHPNEYTITADTVSTPKITDRTIVRSSDTQEGIAGRPAGPVNQADAQTRTHEIEQGSRTETIVLAHNEYVKVEVGKHKQAQYDGRRQTYIDVPDMKSEWVPTQRITVQIVEGQVSSVDMGGAIRRR